MDIIKRKSSKLLDTYPVNSSTFAIKSSLTMLRAFLVANSSLFSVIKFSTSFPIPARNLSEMCVRKRQDGSQKGHNILISKLGLDLDQKKS